jgi:hypothetical protein
VQVAAQDATHDVAGAPTVLEHGCQTVEADEAGSPVRSVEDDAKELRRKLDKISIGQIWKPTA